MVPWHHKKHLRETPLALCFAVLRRLPKAQAFTPLPKSPNLIPPKGNALVIHLVLRISISGANSLPSDKSVCSLAAQCHRKMKTLF